MKIIFRLLQEVKNFIYEVQNRARKIPDEIKYNVPYVCQFATPLSAELSLKKILSPVDDLNWKDTGATSSQRYSQWAFTMCGMASVSMALQYFTNKNIKVVLLAEDALKNGVYIEEKKDISSMRYREFADWIQKYGLKADIYTKLSIKGILYALAQGKLVIVSVNPNIRGYNTAPVNQKGGHLVLVTGYDKNKNVILINNPSGFVSTHTQINHSMLFTEFAEYYAGRGIVLSTQ
jgi:uncharacterized protein YvpB